MADRPTCILLPGFDGSGSLFSPLLAQAPLPFVPRVLALPSQKPCGYDELATWLADQLPTDRPYALLAESFSGPLAIRVASRRPRLLTHLVLVATFLRSPLHSWLSPFERLARSILFSRPPPVLAVRALLAGWNAPSSLVADVLHAMANLPPPVAIGRAHAAILADECATFARVAVPTLWVQASADHLLRSRHVRDVLACRPDARIVAIEGPHMILQRRPRECLAAIAQFLADPSTATQPARR